MSFTYSIKNIEEKKVVDVGFLIYDSLLFNVLKINEIYKSIESINDFIRLINDADFTQINASITDSDLFLKELNNTSSSSNKTDVRKIDFYFNFILDALHYNYNIYLINASTENNVFNVLGNNDLDYLVYDPIKTTISSELISEVKIKNIPILLNSSIRESSFRAIENLYIENNSTDINYGFDDFYRRTELNDENFNQMTFTICGVKRIKRYYGDENIVDDSEFSNSPYVLIPLVSDASGMLSRSYSNYPWKTAAGFNNGKVLNQNFSKINLKNVRVSESIIPQTPTNITFESPSKLYTAKTRGINCIFKISGPEGMEYFLFTDFSGITSSENTVKETFTYSNLYSYIARNVKSIINEFKFELNSSENREIITRNINNLMEDVLLNNGISSYNVICNDINNTDSTIAENRLIVDISFKPIQSPSIISLNFTT
jgi:hypothetical protein